MLPLRIKAPGSNAEPGVFFVRHVKFVISAGNCGRFDRYDRHQLVNTDRLI